MGNLRDICVQVKYRGSAESLAENFYDPMGSAAAAHRAVVNALDPAKLLPIALGFRSASERKLITRLVINVSPLPSNGSDEPLEVDVSAIQNELLQGLDEVTRTLSLEDVSPDAFKVLICILGPEIEAECGSSGYFTDVNRSSVAYQGNWDRESGGRAQMERELLVSWSWGDPKAKVKQELDRFDRVWNGEFPGARVFPADEALTTKLHGVLVALANQPESDIAPKEDIQLFPHQKSAVEEWIKRSFVGVFKMCTGAGKTISALAAVKTLGEMRSDATLPRPPVIITVPTRVLADQWIREIKRFGFQSILAAYNSFEQWNNKLEPMVRDSKAEQSRFIVTTYKTFADPRFVAKLQRMAGFGIEAIWIADEMHNLASPRLRNAMKGCEKLFKFRLGLSATPEIEGDLTATEGLLNYFGKICASYELADGIKDGVLCKYRYYPIPAYLSPKMGEKYLKLLQEIEDKDESGPSTALVNLYREARDLLRTSGVQIARFRDVLNNLVEGVPDLKHTLVYCPPGYGTYGGDVSDEIDTDEGERRLIEDVIEILRSKNLCAASILGETAADQRAQILERFADGRVRALCAIGCLDEGVDVPSIQRAIVLYSVDREKQFVQRRGRILRQTRGTPNKVAEIFDIVILPQGAEMPRLQAESLLNREMRRYREFARLAENRQDADESISKALSVATGTKLTTIIPQYVNQS